MRNTNVNNNNSINSSNDNVGIDETFKHTGWINDTRYRSVIYILTYEECKTSSKDQIEEKIKYEALKNIQRELNITSSRNQSVKIKNLIENYGVMIPDVIKCDKNNIFYFDIQKNNLQIEFQNIKNMK